MQTSEVNVAQALEAKVSRSVRWKKEAPKEVNAIGDEQWTGPISIRFNIANVQRPLAAASKVVGKGNRVVMEDGGGYIENVAQVRESSYAWIAGSTCSTWCSPMGRRWW